MPTKTAAHARREKPVTPPARPTPCPAATLHHQIVKAERALIAACDASDRHRKPGVEEHDQSDEFHRFKRAHLQLVEEYHGLRKSMSWVRPTTTIGALFMLAELRLVLDDDLSNKAEVDRAARLLVAAGRYLAGEAGLRIEQIVIAGDEGFWPDHHATAEGPANG